MKTASISLFDGPLELAILEFTFTLFRRGWSFSFFDLNWNVSPFLNDDLFNTLKCISAAGFDCFEIVPFLYPKRDVLKELSKTRNEWKTPKFELILIYRISCFRSRNSVGFLLNGQWRKIPIVFQFLSFSLVLVLQHRWLGCGNIFVWRVLVTNAKSWCFQCVKWAQTAIYWRFFEWLKNCNVWKRLFVVAFGWGKNCRMPF